VNLLGGRPDLAQVVPATVAVPPRATHIRNGLALKR
jgi:hypothetical protein